MRKIQSNAFFSWLLIHLQGGCWTQGQPYVDPLTSFQLWSTMLRLGYGTHQLWLVFTIGTLILRFILSFSLWYVLVIGINKPTRLLYLSTFCHIQALSNIWRWIVSLPLQLPLILFDVGIPISILLKDMFLITPIEIQYPSLSKCVVSQGWILFPPLLDEHVTNSCDQPRTLK